MSDLPLVSIVCVTHGRPNFLRKCLTSCLGQSYPNKEVVVLLNPDDSRAACVVHEVAPQAQVVRTHRNLGFFPALNIVIANTSGDYVMTVDDDAWFLDERGLERMVRAFQDEPDLGAVTCNLEGPHEATNAGPDRYVPVFKTGFTMVPRQAFTHWVGWYPDIFFRSAGETFLCSALWEQGRPVKCLAEARMYHERAVEGRSNKEWLFHGQRSQALCAVMRDPLAILPIILASKMFGSFRVCAFEWRQPLTWLHVWGSFLMQLPKAWRLRVPISFATWKLLRRLRAEYVTENPSTRRADCSL
jgi:GT2 family glycosyltransferase